MVQKVLAKNLIFIDESGVNLAMTRLHGRSYRGTRAHGKRLYQRGKNISLIGALGQSGLIAKAEIMGAVDGLTFEAFIARRLVPKLWKGACVILDNCSIHLNKEITKLIKKAKAKVIYLPPYSPDFSPIEHFWSKLKSILRSEQPRTYTDLSVALEAAFEKISVKDIQNWFTHCCYCTS